jgi:hypothetical protein
MWMIAPKDASQININFTLFETQADTDWVSVFECTGLDCPNATLLARRSGSYPSGALYLTSSTGFVKVIFSSDASGTAPGFNASWDSRISPDAAKMDELQVVLLVGIALCGALVLILVIKLFIQKRNRIASVAAASVSY